MNKVVITGAAGIVGTVLVKGLQDDFNSIPLDYDQCDLTKLDQVQKSIPNDTDVIIHLAWKAGELYKNGKFDSDNILMTLNVLETAVQKKIPRVILASSVHTNEYRAVHLEKIASFRHSGEDPPVGGDDSRIPANVDPGRAHSSLARMTTDFDWPTSIYGATKIYLEALGRYYAKYHRLEVVAIRLGGVNPENSSTYRDEIDYEKVFLSHEDLILIFKSLIVKDKIPNNYECLYAVSDPKK